MAMKLIKNPAVRHYFKTDLKKNYVFFIIGLVLNLISFPLTLGVYIIEENSTYYVGYLAEMFAALSFIFTGIAVLSGIVIAIHNFSYLHKKHETDTYMAFPLSDRQRFFCDYFSGLLCYIIPMIIAGIICVIISFVAMATVEDYQYSLLGTYGFSLAGIVAKAYFMAIVCMTALYTLSVLACTLCGSLFETALNTVIVNGIIPGMIALVSFIAFNQVVGINVSNIMLPLLSKTSPLGAVISFFTDVSLINYDVFELLYVLKFSLWLIIFTAGYAALSYFLYKKRKAEDVAKPYVFKAFYYIVITCMTFAICAVIPSEADFLFFPMLLVAAVVYLIFEAITNRGLKNFKFSALRCVSTIAVSLLVIALLNNPWGFGAATRVPKVSSVKSVTVDYLGVVKDYYHGEESITFKDEKAIEIIVGLHEDIVERTDFKENYDGPFDYNFYYGLENTYTITYKLKNGSTFTRSYSLTRDDIYVLTQLEALEEYPQQITEVFRKELNDMNEIYFNTILGYSNVVVTDNYASNYASYSCSPDEFEDIADELSKAIEADLSERTLEEIRNPKTPYGYFPIGNTRIYVYENDERIVSVLKKYNLFDLTPQEYLSENPEEVLIDEVNRFNTEEQKKYSRITSAVNSDLTYYSFVYNIDEVTDEYYDLQKEILLNVVPYSFDKGEHYFIMNQESSLIWFVPSDYADEAQALYDLGKQYYQNEHPENYKFENDEMYEDESEADTDEDVIIDEEFNDAA